MGVVFIGWDGLAERGIRLSRSTIYRKMKEGSFPQSVKIGQQTLAWVKDEIDQWIQDRINERKPQPKFNIDQP